MRPPREAAVRVLCSDAAPASAEPSQGRAWGGFASNHPVHFASQPSEKLQCLVSHAAPPEVRREVQHTGVTRSRTI